MKRGYFALWRRFQDHQFWKERRVFSKAEAWIDILWNVQWNEEPQEVVLGMTTLTQYYAQSLKSIRTWGKRWGWGEAKVARFLKLLQGMNQIRYKSEGITTRITVLNYEQYDPKRHTSETAAKQQRNTSETRAKTNNNNNKVYKEKKVNIYSNDFLKFWEKYPIGGDKKYASNCWEKKRKQKRLPQLDIIFKKIKEESDYKDYLKKSGEFCPEWKAPSTWINKECWENEFKTPIQQDYI